MRPPEPLPPALAASAFTVQAAAREGVSRARLERPGLFRPTHGVRSPVAITDVGGMARAFAAVLPDDCVFSHETAARLWGLPVGGVWQPEHPVHVIRVTGKQPIRRRRVVAHTALEERQVEQVEGVVVTSLLDTWVDVAESSPLAEGVVLGDALVGPPWGLPISVLAQAVEARRDAAEIVRRALGLVRVGSASAMETRTRVLFMVAGLPEPELNAKIYDTDCSLLAIGDLVWRAAKLIVEYEGDQHRSDRAQWLKDIARYRRLQELGWHVIRATAADVQRDSQMLVAMVRALLERRWAS